MPENEDFCLSFELFSWVSDFLSFGVLEFFSGVHKKKPVIGTLKSQNLTKFSFQVCTELDNHYSMNDKDLAEFIIDLAQKHADLEVRTTRTYQFTYFDSAQAF